MSKRTRFPSDPVELDLTPMIDIVFNLLIFFMCATTFRSEEGMIQAFLPKDLGPSNKPSAAIDITQVRVRLLWYGPDGKPTRDRIGHVVLKIDHQRFNAPGDFEALEHPETSPVWKDLHERIVEFRDAYSGESLKGLPVIIDARKQVPTKYVISTLNEIVRADIEDVTFAAPEIPY